MKLWEIKAQSLRLMFADTGLNFSEEEFRDKTVYQNGNTREKLVRMGDAINRALDLYYQYNGDITRRVELGLHHSDDTYKNKVSPIEENVDDFGLPTRIDVVRNLDENIIGAENISFDFDYLTKEIRFPDYDFVPYGDAIVFLIYYKMSPRRLSNDASDFETDLDDMNIPVNVQNHIPLFVKGELYEEDEAELAKASKNEYIQFLINNQRNTFSRYATRVKSKFPRS